MIRGPHVVTIFSEDITPLIAFYRDLVGLPVRREADGFVMFGPEGGPFLGLGNHSEVRGAASDPNRNAIVFEVDDIHAEYARLRGAGIDFLEPPSDDEDGVPLKFAAFRDPDGNLLQIVQILEPI